MFPPVSQSNQSGYQGDVYSVTAQYLPSVSQPTANYKPVSYFIMQKKGNIFEHLYVEVKVTNALKSKDACVLSILLLSEFGVTCVLSERVFVSLLFSTMWHLDATQIIPVLLLSFS